MVYTVTFNPAVDCFMIVEQLSFDTINRTTAEDICFGGKGINVSVVLTRLGVENRALGFIGGFTGNMLEEMLKAEAVVCDFNYLKTGHTRINVKIRSKKELDINANGPKISKNDIENLLQKLAKLRADDYLVLSGAVSNNLPDNIYEQILKRLDGRGVNFVVDATGKLLTSTLKYKPFLVKPNHYELGEIFKVNADSKEKIIKYARRLQSLGAQNVLVSMAQNGAVLIDSNGKVHKMDNICGKFVDSVGCGDSMVAGFIAGYIQKNDYSYALKLGTACGNATAFSAGLADKEKINLALEKIMKNCKE